MTDSIALGPDGQVNQSLTLLRDGLFGGDLAGRAHILPGIDIHADPAMALSGSYCSPEGWLLEIDAQAARPGKWFGLHVAFPARDLDSCAVLGFVARSAAPEIQIVRACLRSGTDDGFVDCFFDKHILMCPEEASHVDVLQIHQRDSVPPQAPWRELIFFFPTKSFRASLIDLRVFLV